MYEESRQCIALEPSESSAVLEVVRTFSVDVPQYGGRKSTAAATTQCADCEGSVYKGDFY